MAGDGEGTDDDVTPEPPAARRAFFPSSIGLSLLVSKATRRLKVELNWGDYRAEPVDGPHDGEEVTSEGGGRIPLRWKRQPRRVEMMVDLPPETARAVEHEVPDSDGLRVAVSVRSVQTLGIAEGMVPDGTRSASIFLVNHRTPVQASDVWDERFIFQAGLSVHADEPLIPRPNLKGHVTEEWDERVADLQYRDVYEFAVGHGIATHAQVDADGACRIRSANSRTQALSFASFSTRCHFPVPRTT